MSPTALIFFQLFVLPTDLWLQKSNPLPEKDKLAQGTVGSKRKILRDQLCAEREAFGAVFDKRGQRIDGVDMHEE